MKKRRSRPSIKQSWPIETELRLAGDAATLETVFGSPLMASKGDGEDKLTDLESGYYDTEDQQLRAKGLAFRVRTDAGGHCQTLKAGDSAPAALLKRAEWNVAVDSPLPALDVLPEQAKALLPKEARQGRLQKAFTTRVQRRTRLITTEGEDRPFCRIEAALDLGEIETERGVLPIAELELELLEGEAQCLYQLALDLQNVGPLRLETRSKSSRAYDRLGDRPPSSHQATTPPLKPVDTVDDAMAAILGSCFRHWLANQAAAIDGRDPEGVHQMRVGLRRLRSALSVFKTLINEDQRAWLQEGARRSIAALGPARDWDVFQTELLAPVIAARPEDPSLRALRTKASAKGKAHYRAARKSLEQADYTRFALRVGQWIEARGWRAGADDESAGRQAMPIAAFAATLLKKRYQRALKRGRNMAGQTSEQRHDLRIALKKLRYSVEFFAPLFDKKAMKPFLKHVKALQNDLGRMNDVAVAEALLKDLLAKPGKPDLSGAAGMVIGWHACQGMTIETGLLETWQAVTDGPAFWT